MSAAASRCRRGTAVVALAAATLSGLVAVGGNAAADAGPRSTFLLTAAPGALGDLTRDLDTPGAEVTDALEGVGMAVVEATPAAVADLAGDERVAGLVPDTGARLTASSYDASSDANSMFNVTSTVGARTMWSGKWSSYTGRGVDVALLDSGVSPVEGLDGAGKVVNGPDLSFDSQQPSTRYLDGFGHGTHMAGIIAGRDADADPSKNGKSDTFMGVAPDARVVSVKVADAYGNADVSQIIAGIDWVVEHRKDPGMNIRVLNLSLGTPSTQSYVLDPLAYAAEQAWHKGIVVVVAAGNDGTGTGRLLNPAHDPYLIAVGADDSKGTNGTNDDVIPEFSTRGDGVRNPDLVAPGTSIQSLRVPGSVIDQQHQSTGGINDRFFRGSGTSQAAAVVSGAAALVLEERPTATPDQVKALLTGATRTLPAADPQAQGNGILDLRKLDGGLVVAKQLHLRATGLGTLDAARGGFHVETEDGKALTGQKDIFGKSYSAATMASRQATETAWSGGSWNGSRWTGSSWGPQGWSGTTWSGTDWTGRMWAGRMWAGGTWTGRMWADGYWNGRMWAGRMWAGRMWANGSWS